MIQIAPQMRLLVAVEPADFRRGIDGLVRVCREALGADPFSGAVFVFRNRRATAIKLLTYDGQGFWLCHKRLSQARFPWWPSEAGDASQRCRFAALSKRRMRTCSGCRPSTGRRFSKPR